MLDRIAPQTLLTIKKYGYLIALLTAMLPLWAYSLGQQYAAPNLFAYFTIFYIFFIVPIFDYLIGQDSVNPEESTQSASMEGDYYYRLLTWAVLPVMLTILLWGGHIFVSWEGLTPLGQLGWAMSIGQVGGILAINVGHELIHKDNKFERGLGGILLSLVCYAGFKVEHLRGHHVHVSTPKDASSARYDQSLYHFLLRAYYHNFVNAWKLEARRLQYRGEKILSVHNELIGWYSLSALLATGFGLAFGLAGVVYFLLQSFFAFTLLEIVNYIEHYGLHRRKLENGRYERTTHLHSWNSNYLLSNLFLFQLQRHSDHHENPRRRYQVLRHFDASPQLPGGYSAMILLALLPPLWRRVMNPRVQAFYQDAPLT